MTHTYAPGDLVKIISMEEVRKYPEVTDGRQVNNLFWHDEMDHYAGTIRKVERLNVRGNYVLEHCCNWEFSPEMISGPAEAEVSEPDTDRQEYAERLERFVLAVATSWTWEDTPEDIVLAAKRLMAAFDEEVKKYKP